MSLLTTLTSSPVSPCGSRRTSCLFRLYGEKFFRGEWTIRRHRRRGPSGGSGLSKRKSDTTLDTASVIYSGLRSSCGSYVRSLWSHSRYLNHLRRTRRTPPSLNSNEKTSCSSLPTQSRTVSYWRIFVCRGLR